MDIDQFRAAVDALMKPTYGLTWHEASGERLFLRRAIEEGETPEAFVAWWVNKHGLKRLDDPTFFDCDACGRDCGEVYCDARTGDFFCEDCVPPEVLAGQGR